MFLGKRLRQGRKTDSPIAQAKEFGFPVKAIADPEQAAAPADIIVTTTLLLRFPFCKLPGYVPGNTSPPWGQTPSIRTSWLPTS